MSTATKEEVLRFYPQSSADLAKLTEMVGYGEGFRQMTFNNGASASSLIEFFNSNQGAVEAVMKFIHDNINAYELEEEEEEDEEDE